MIESSPAKNFWLLYITCKRRKKKQDRLFYLGGTEFDTIKSIPYQERIHYLLFDIYQALDSEPTDAIIWRQECPAQHWISVITDTFKIATIPQ